MPTVNVNSINMYYEVHGEDEPLVILWGPGGEIEGFADMLVDSAARRYRVISFDCRGTGRADKPDEPYTVDMMAGDTIGLMDALNVERAHLLAISLGARIALAIAAKYPERVRSLVLNAAAARAPLEDPGATRSYQRSRETPSKPPGLAVLEKHTPAVESSLWPFEALKSFDSSGLLRRIKAPTLIVNGTKDASTPVKCAKELENGIPDARLVLVDEDHMFIRSKPGLLLKPAIEFLAEASTH